MVSIHLLEVGRHSIERNGANHVSIPLPRKESDPDDCSTSSRKASSLFQSTLPPKSERAATTRPARRSPRGRPIVTCGSIHALRKGERHAAFDSQIVVNGGRFNPISRKRESDHCFNSYLWVDAVSILPSKRRATQRKTPNGAVVSIPPSERRATTAERHDGRTGARFNPLLPLQRNAGKTQPLDVIDVNHAPSEVRGDRAHEPRRHRWLWRFNRSPSERRPTRAELGRGCVVVSIHAPLERATAGVDASAGCQARFQSTLPSRKVRRRVPMFGTAPAPVSIHAPLRKGDCGWR